MGVVVAAAGPRAEAVTTVFTDRPTFTATASGPLTTETLEDDAVAVKPSPTTLAGSNLGLFIQSGTVDIQVRNTDPSGFGTVNTTPGGSRFLTFGYANLALGSFAAQFSSGSQMTAFGMDLSGYQGAANGTGSFTVTLLDGAATVDSVVVPDTTQFTAHFRGFISTVPFSGIRFSFSPLGGDAADILAFDDITFNVPEPASLAAGLLGLGLLRRRRAA